MTVKFDRSRFSYCNDDDLHFYLKPGFHIVCFVLNLLVCYYFVDAHFSRENGLRKVVILTSF